MAPRVRLVSVGSWVTPQAPEDKSWNQQDGEGTREYIRVLRLLEKHPIASLANAVQKGLRIHTHTRDAIAQFLYP